jgi:hypothetical protein
MLHGTKIGAPTAGSATVTTDPRPPPLPLAAASSGDAELSAAASSGRDIAMRPLDVMFGIVMVSVSVGEPLVAMRGSALLLLLKRDTRSKPLAKDL